MLKRAWPDLKWVVPGLVFVLLVMLWISHETGGTIWGHTGYDSYAYEAMAWRHGHVTVENRTWLELAVYHGHYYVSFPPLPAVVMLVFTFFFQENTPSGTVAILYFFGGLISLFLLVRRYRPAEEATLWIIFVALGGSIMGIVAGAAGTSGGVWFQAQLFAFFLLSTAFLLVDGDSKRGWFVGGACLALAVGCRPFDIVFAPVLLWMLLGKLGYEKKAILPYLIPPVIILACYGIYNAARFGVPWEFGHKYLPELKQAGEPMFIPARIPQNVDNVLRGFSIKQGKMDFPIFSGFAIYFTNPILLFGGGLAIVRAFQRKIDVTTALLFATSLFLALALLSHRTNGGWAYGTRYLIDLLPAVMFLIARNEVRIRTLGAVLIGALIMFNVLATTVFNTIPLG